MNTKKNPVVYSDYPDPDIIRVGDTYYMASTTMHYMPGCDILRSYDLMNWELVAHAYDVLERTPGHELEGESQVYGQGMWAPSFRYHQGTFYITFTGNDTHKTYLLTAKRPEGPWEKRNIEGFYYDNGLFFDDDGRVYIVHGQKTLWITELDAGLNGPKKGGMNRIIAQDQEDAILGYEGSHLQKHNGRYYLFTCHMLPEDGGRKTQVCFAADSLEEEFQGKCIINDDMGYHDLGVAQGGMIDTPDGDWYLFMFQDKGALGRAPVMIPMHFEDGFPAVSGDGKVPLPSQFRAQGRNTGTSRSTGTTILFTGRILTAGCGSSCSGSLTTTRTTICGRLQSGRARSGFALERYAPACRTPTIL